MSTRSGTWRAPRTIAVARGLWLAALGGLAALYFHGTVMSTIELMDEGQVVYSSWRVAEGEMPYVGFHQLYGPSVFFVNGALLKLFGVDLRVIRLSLVALKALVAVLAYVRTRLAHVSGREGFVSWRSAARSHSPSRTSLRTWRR